LMFIVYSGAFNQLPSLIFPIHHSCVIFAGCRSLEHHFTGWLCVCLWWRKGHG
jgi:hypothetical protein